MARRAVADAMPFLKQAQKVLVTAVDDIDPKGASESVADVVRFLMKHGVKAQSEIVEVGNSQAADALADLGCRYRRESCRGRRLWPQPAAEWAFGGVTRSLLRNSGLHRFFSN